MRTDRTLTKMSSEPVAMKPIVDRMTDARENITFPCGKNEIKKLHRHRWYKAKDKLGRYHCVIETMDNLVTQFSNIYLHIV